MTKKERKMEKVLAFIKENKTFFIATIDGDQPRVRPCGLMLNLNGKLSICTSIEKDVFKQIEKNNKIELCSMTPDGTFLRLTGTVSFNYTQEAKSKVFEAMPRLAKIYENHEDKLVICGFDHVTAVYQTMRGEKETQILY
jgi:uncharacterized pyridoxamine 5'-phosphate oxidase family protein